MNMKPILFNTDMVRAILEGRKTVTRRVALPANDLKPFPQKDYPDGWMFRKRAYRSWDSVIREPNKQMIMGDVLIDDGPHNFIGGNYSRILFDQPHNRGFAEKKYNMYSAKSWEDVYRIIHQNIIPDRTGKIQ